MQLNEIFYQCLIMNSAFKVWKVRVRVQISKSEFHTYTLRLY